MPDALSIGVLMLTYLAMEAVAAKANDMDVHNHGCRIRDSPFGIDALEPLFSDFDGELVFTSSKRGEKKRRMNSA